ncbi:hypothetical protein E2C01_046519 [Portunus trituberculatus]|uniref:Uncharacterized protein n=1 Tax=Portunus trituberculatus TaxID=210409 RepID=A0A5B7G7Z5_PORTR|nr:hypothetical protein [Portunus trituberculatus]
MTQRETSTTRGVTHTGEALVVVVVLLVVPTHWLGNVASRTSLSTPPSPRHPFLIPAAVPPCLLLFMWFLGLYRRCIAPIGLSHHPAAFSLLGAITLTTGLASGHRSVLPDFAHAYGYFACRSPGLMAFSGSDNASFCHRSHQNLFPKLSLCAASSLASAVAFVVPAVMHTFLCFVGFFSVLPEHTATNTPTPFPQQPPTYTLRPAAHLNRCTVPSHPLAFGTQHSTPHHATPTPHHHYRTKVCPDHIQTTLA